MDLAQATEADIDALRELFLAYARTLPVDLSFQGFADEVDALPGDYVAPHGALILGRVDGAPAGCVAVHRWDERSCEMKRLFVRDAYLGRGFGRALALHAIEWARAAGYSRMLLDTLPTMVAAQRLYEELGFRDVAAYRFNPVEGSRYLALELG